MPRYPDPSEKDEKGDYKFKTHEAFLIQYYKDYGIAQAVKQIFQFFDHNEQDLKMLLEKASKKEDDEVDNLYGQI